MKERAAQFGQIGMLVLAIVLRIPKARDALLDYYMENGLSGEEAQARFDEYADRMRLPIIIGAFALALLLTEVRAFFEPGGWRLLLSILGYMFLILAILQTGGFGVNANSQTLRDKLSRLLKRK